VINARNISQLVFNLNEPAIVTN